ncbi:unnamed protein product [Acanthoscelides obtectus]|uniref:AAA+ ATPase domain-containing protein n=1 Tax=Acanthoscelides obtectus TaxID=200917 RepID=A0A9P0LXI2_ACAOB|nr:unnamed protein product [Acanthoscelides obtectus]CAK1677936.1 Spermatogenesis-associated protein 5 [Acanthoscelides obtectus]
MSQQKLKKPHSPWVQCEQCCTSLLPKDSSIHKDDCPPNTENPRYILFRDGVLYGTVDVKGQEEIKNISSRELDNMVFLSQSAMQLCNLCIGQWASIQSTKNSIPPVARIVWPTVEKSATSALFTRNALDLTSLNLNEIVAVKRLQPDTLPLASQIYLIALNPPKQLELTSELTNRISRLLEGRILTFDNIFSIFFYGKQLKFLVKHIKPADSSQSIESKFNELRIKKEYAFYMVDRKTNLELYRDQCAFEKQELQKQSDRIPVGVEKEVHELQTLMKACLSKNSKPSCLPHIKSVLLYGNSGTGKTMIANFVARESKANIFTVCAPDLYSIQSNSIEETIKKCFKNAVENAPSVLVMDEIDILCPQRSGRLTDSEKRSVSTLLLLLDNLEHNANVFIITTSNKPENIDPSFRRCGRLDREIEIPTPTPACRKAILSQLLSTVPNNVIEQDLHNVALKTHGFVGADLVLLFSLAGLNSAKRSDVGMIEVEDLNCAMKQVRPSAMREVQIEVSMHLFYGQVPNVKWSDIGGQERLKLILKQSVEWPLKHPESFSRLGVTPPKGVLMFGPPGCSKTMIAKALATESGLNFLSIKGPELFSKWVGESERAVREVFRKARQVAPSIIFFDEIDALGGERSSGSTSSVQERVLAQLLTELDGITSLSDVTIVAATNRPDRIDKALLRPGRLDRMVYVPLPDEGTRKEIFRIRFLKMPVSLQVNVDIDDLVSGTHGYSGAEITAICNEAAMMALEESLDSKVVEQRHFEAALRMVQPRTPAAMIRLFEDYLKN